MVAAERDRSGALAFADTVNGRGVSGAGGVTLPPTRGRGAETGGRGAWAVMGATCCKPKHQCTGRASEPVRGSSDKAGSCSCLAVGSG